MQRVLIASPIRGGCSPTYVRTLMSLLFSKVNKPFGGPNAPFDFQWAATSGTSVAMARDELASVAIKQGFDKLLFWDIDLGAANPDVTVSMFARLLSHNEDVVGGQYVGHNFLSAFHGATVENSTGPRADGLLEMSQIPLGFSVISVKALKTIREKKPERQYVQKETGRESKTDMFEFFPNGVCGPNTAEGKIERIRKAFAKREATDSGINSEADFVLMESIEKTLADTDYSANYMLGEDYYFCKLARESGVKLWIDNNLIIPHDTGIRLPVKNQDVLTALCEEWRLANNATPAQIKPIVEQLRPLLSPDIP